MTILEQEVPVVTAHGHMPTHIFQPSDAMPCPAVIVFMDAPGIRDELLDVARRLARAGYCCALPDLYYRIGRFRFDLTHRTEVHAAVYRALRAALVNDQVASDTECLLRYLAMQPQVSNGVKGCLGYSVGGRFAIQAAGLFPAHIAAAASVCGTDIVTEQDDSPHRVLDRARARLLFEFAETDPQVPEHVIPTLRSALGEAEDRYQINVEPGTAHGYSFPMRPMFNAAAAENTWRRILSLFDRSLRATQ